MKVSASSGREYKVQFVHSSHDFTESEKPVTPGGLRQFVDNLALSLRRRVSFADISLVEHGNNYAEDTKDVVYTSLGQGFALCHHTDQFHKKTGRAYAFDRALMNVRINGEPLTYAEQDELWAAIWGETPPSRPSEFGF